MAHIITSPELRVFVENSLVARIANLKTVEECGHASRAIDYYEESCRSMISYEVESFVSYVRNYLCDRTFELYIEKYKPTQR